MRDRQIFAEHKLTNGITVYHYPEPEAPFTLARIQLPVGSSNSTAPITPGSVHFLEHAMTDRSQKYPKRNEFNRLVGLKAGSFGSETGPFDTTYFLAIPSRHNEMGLEGLFSHVFEPKIEEEDVALNRGIISNERRRKERWFPGSSELGQYMMLSWQHDQLLTLRQRLGYDEDLAQITPESLLAVQKSYFDPRIRVIIGGSGDPTSLIKKLETLRVTQHELPQQYELIHWVNKEYHEHAFRDVARYELRYGAFYHPRPDVQDVVAIGFLLSYLTNHIHGPLYQWLREDKGWVYDLDYGYSVNNLGCDWTLCLPMSQPDHVDEVRQQLWARVEKALEDSDGLNSEVERKIDARVAFGFQRLGDVINTAQDSLEIYDRIISEAEWRQLIEFCRSSENMKKIYAQYFSPDQIGSFLAKPLQESA